MNSDVVQGYTRHLSSFGEVGSSMGCMWELDGLKPSFHGLDMRVGWFEAFIPWVGHGGRLVWGLHSMGWMWGWFKVEVSCGVGGSPMFWGLGVCGLSSLGWKLTSTVQALIQGLQ